MGIARAFELTVMQILVPGLVPLPLVPRAVAGSATANQTATIAGPALGGFLYAAGPAIVYSASLALFLAAGVLVALIRMERAAPAREPFSLQSSSRASASSAAIRSCSARSRSTCSRCCSAP